LSWAVAHVWALHVLTAVTVVDSVVNLNAGAKGVGVIFRGFWIFWLSVWIVTIFRTILRAISVFRVIVAIVAIFLVSFPVVSIFVISILVVRVLWSRSRFRFRVRSCGPETETETDQEYHRAPLGHG
jgi:hypothetical protein